MSHVTLTSKSVSLTTADTAAERISGILRHVLFCKGETTLIRTVATVSGVGTTLIRTVATVSGVGTTLIRTVVTVSGVVLAM